MTFDLVYSVSALFQVTEPLTSLVLTHFHLYVLHKGEARFLNVLSFILCDGAYYIFRLENDQMP